MWGGLWALRLPWTGPDKARTPGSLIYASKQNLRFLAGAIGRQAASLTWRNSLEVYIPPPLHVYSRAHSTNREGAACKIKLPHPDSSAVGEFADVDCPYCLRWVSGARPAFEKRFVESGQVRFAFFQLPLPMHPGAEAAAVAMECAGSQGAFWPMHDLLFRPDRPRDRDGFVASAAVLDLDSEMFGKCLTNPPPKVGRDQALAAELGINGTPTFIVGTFDADGAIRPRFKIVGAPNERRLADLIKQLVAN